ncbi:related to myosin heavy chain [Cephalotrichum gorgonifer]|uniref:Autophagy-related protein 11 n=1 Tax=Cephalotrichum gorgonifer TaxID=2041049 RepID=A0AAE8MVP9_9PEZI|nr:related to myosin heavy chain [Cephalotrichum gorgonifer]
MASEVLVAHTGQRLQVDTAQFSSIDELKAWVSRQSSIPVPKIVALTPEGRSLKPQSLHSESEIYIYDIRITQTSSSGNGLPAVTDIPLPKQYSTPTTPNSIGDIKAMSAWEELYKERRAWALGVAEDCSRMDQATQQRYGEIDVMVKCLDAAVANLEFSIKQIEPKYVELKKWVEPALEEHEQLAANWEKYLALAKAVPISHHMVRFMTSKDVKPNQATLEDLIDMDTTRKAGRLAPTSLRKFSGRATDLDKAASRMYQALQDITQEFESLISRSALSHNGESSQLQSDVEALAKKIDSDYKQILEYTPSQRDVLQASKTASTHTERLLPSLKKRANEMGDMIQYATRARNEVAADSIKFMRSITEITSLHGSVKAQINALNQAEEDMTTFDYLRLIHQLPYMYASFLSEAVRRREWYDKVRSDSSTLANTMALFQDEEIKRRRKWQKMVGSTYGRDMLDANAIGLEVNLLGDEDPWPALTKQDLETFLESLKKHNAEALVIDDVSKLLGELGAPTKQQSKRIKAFKNGSIHEASLGISGLLMRGDDDLLRSLQDDKTKLENRLKTSDSRIRRLEDLLHRQSQASRTGLGNVFQAQNGDSTSSVKPPGKQTDGTESLLHRITQLESDLHAEQQRSAAAKKELDTHAARSNEIRDQMEEANSTKKDLLGNMEALKREFIEERKSLEHEIKRLQVRLEDGEDEIEHVGEAREQEKSSYNEKILALQEEIERLQMERKDDSLRTQGQVDFLRNESRAQRERNENLEKQVRELQEEVKQKTTALEEAVATSDARLYALHNIYGQIVRDKAAPQDAGTLVQSINATASDARSQLQTAKDDAVSLRSKLAETRAAADELSGELQGVSAKLAAEEKALSELKAALVAEKSRSQALENELEDAKQELTGLHARIANGETGSESLRKRSEEQEGKLAALHRELASKQSEVGRVEEELHSAKEKLEDSKSKLVLMTRHLDTRGERAKDLTQRMYSQNDRLCRLLERLGFSVSLEGSTMAVQKIPRAERASHMQNTTDLSDPAASALRQSSLAQLGDGSPDTEQLELLYWANSKDDESESEKYQAFMSHLGRFDIDLFSETIFRRVKDMEHLARKFQRDARMYREKGVAFQREAHEKIAFKNFKEGDLALFLPTRNQSSGAWACFNIGCPHYFLREQDSHGLTNREWLVARISRVQERVVDLSKSVQQPGDADSLNDEGNDNPFQLSDGLRWYLLDAHEDKHGAPSTPGLGKSTVAANTVEAVADMRTRLGTGGKHKTKLSQHSIEGVSKTLSKSLESRRGSSSSRKTLPFTIGGGGLLKGTPLASETNSVRAAASETASGTSPTTGAQAGPSNAQQASSREAKASADDGAAADRGKGLEGPTPQLNREQSAISAEDPVKRSVVYESLWSLDYSYESPKKR